MCEKLTDREYCDIQCNSTVIHCDIQKQRIITCEVIIFCDLNE